MGAMTGRAAIVALVLVAAGLGACAESAAGLSTPSQPASSQRESGTPGTAAPAPASPPTGAASPAATPNAVAPTERVVQRLSPATDDERRAALGAGAVAERTGDAASASAVGVRGGAAVGSDTTISPRHLEAELNRLEAELAN